MPFSVLYVYRQNAVRRIESGKLFVTDIEIVAFKNISDIPWRTSSQQTINQSDAAKETLAASYILNVLF